MENEIEPLCKDDGSDLKPDFQQKLAADLKVIEADLGSCKDCWEEGLSWVEKKKKEKAQTGKDDINVP